MNQNIPLENVDMKLPDGIIGIRLVIIKIIPDSWYKFLVFKKLFIPRYKENNIKIKNDI